ncbi:kinetochore protein NDC80 homolog [Engystomops pustulosus]|uniref:kinetochore protein NDC80 homolog n=1 Tax=Engystomops pustulosus TaxID=76066 RepID=UPI003AFA5D42
MEKKFHNKYSRFPAKDKMEKNSHRHGCGDLRRIRRTQGLDYPPDRASVHDCMKLLEELLADGGRAGDCPGSCRCRESPCLLDSLALVFSRLHNKEHRHRVALKSPYQLLRGLFLHLDAIRRWNKMVMAAPLLQDLLEMCCTVLIPKPPRGMCLSCRERRAVVPEVCTSRRHKCSNYHPESWRSAERAMDGYGCLCDPEPTADLSVVGQQRYDQRLDPGLLPSIQQLKNSLKKDLETHQLYLRAIETRLSGLERRTQDVTEHLERANLELEAIKQGNVTLKTLVHEQISSLGTEDLEDLWKDKAWRTRRPPEFSRSSECPAGGSRYRRDDLQSGLSALHVDVLIHQITRQINLMESDIQNTMKLRHNTR